MSLGVTTRAMNSDTQPQKKQTHPFLTVSGLLGGVIGFYCGTTLFVPFAGGIIVLLLAKRFASASVKPFIGALAIQFGHWLWMLVGGIWGPTGMSPVILDLVLIIVGLVWLVARPSLGPIVLLCIYQAFSLVVNIIAIFGQEFGSIVHKALTASIALRLFAVAALDVGYRQLRKSREELVANAA